MAESSSIPLNSDKPVIVRVKRKAFQSSLDAFWLEIHERPLKRPLLDFEKLSISDVSSSRVEELKSKKILVQHVETVHSSEDTFDVLRSFVPNSSDGLKSKEKHEEGRRNIKTVNRQDHLLAKAKQKQEILSRNARFEQIWRSRKGKKEAPEDEALYEMCRLYDVVRVDVEEQKVELQKAKDTELDDCRVMAQYLPLLREALPTAAVEIENDIQDCMSKQDGYVYDLYAVKEDTDVMEADFASQIPLVQVDDDDDDYYDGPDDSEYETDDSNAEKNPLNDYPDEETSGDEDEVTSKSSDEESDGESRTSGSHSQDELESGSQVSSQSEGELESGSQVLYGYEDSGVHEWSDNADFFEDELYFDGDDEQYWE